MQFFGRPVMSMVFSFRFHCMQGPTDCRWAPVMGTDGEIIGETDGRESSESFFFVTPVFLPKLHDRKDEVAEQIPLTAAFLV